MKGVISMTFLNAIFVFLVPVSLGAIFVSVAFLIYTFYCKATYNRRRIVMFVALSVGSLVLFMAGFNFTATPEQRADWAQKRAQERVEKEQKEAIKKAQKQKAAAEEKQQQQQRGCSKASFPFSTPPQPMTLISFLSLTYIARTLARAVGFIYSPPIPPKPSFGFMTTSSRSVLM